MDENEDLLSERCSAVVSWSLSRRLIMPVAPYTVACYTRGGARSPISNGGAA